MKIVELLLLSIKNFKGCKSLDLELGGRSVSIYGDNATGKSTIYDALTWLLFGKDSRGQSDFEIKPLDPNGKVQDHAAVSTVSAQLRMDGVETTLKKTYFEKWSMKRGSATETYDGNTSEYFVDEVPVKKYEFERRVGELVDEDLFRMLTNVFWFCDGMDWKSRRKALFDVCSIPDDRIIMAGEPRFAELSAALGPLTVDDYKKKLMAQRKGLNGTRNTIPARLDEQRQVIEGLSTLDFDGLRAQRAELEAQRDKLSGELLKLDHGALLDSKRNELGRLKNELSAYINENARHRQSQMIPVEDKRPAMQAALDREQREAARCSQLADNERSLMEDIQGKIERCRQRWAEEDARIFEEENCPTCGQPLPVLQMAAAQLRFEQEKEGRKEEIVSQADLYKRELAAANERLEQYNRQAAQAEGEAARLTSELAAYVPQEQPEPLDMPGYGQQVETAQGRIQVLSEEISKLSEETAAIREEIGQKVQQIQREMARLDQELGKAGSLEYARRRERELRQEAQQTAKALEALDQQIYLCEEFSRTKVQYIEGAINGTFQLAQFKLFQEQVNGGLMDCCEPMCNGVPYRSLNSGAQINLGVDVIRTMSVYHGLRVPLIIDNAESVTSLLDGETQVIRLVVSGKDKELRCEYGA